MFKTIVTTASAALVALTFAASAHAALVPNGALNGLASNGALNGAFNGTMNGAINGTMNGTLNGAFNGSLNGMGTQGAAMGTITFAIDGIDLPATVR